MKNTAFIAGLTTPLPSPLPSPPGRGPTSMGRIARGVRENRGIHFDVRIPSRRGRYGCPSAPSRRERGNARGFTLVEILTSMFVLMLGIIGILSVIMRSSQMGTAASDRNNASVLLVEAIADIQRMHLITTPYATTYGLTAYDGEFMDTISLKSGTNPFENASLPYAVNGVSSQFVLDDIAYTAAGTPANLAYWPLNPALSRVMGQYPQAGGDQLLNNNGSTYRALYRLEPNPDWVPDPTNRDPLTRENLDSAYVGQYLLTIAMYRDLDPAKPTTDATKRLQQIADPIVVTLRDKKVRN